jgi:hypothetical protein
MNQDFSTFLMIIPCFYLLFFWIKKNQLPSQTFFKDHLKRSLLLFSFSSVALLFVRSSFYFVLIFCWAPLIFLLFYRLANIISQFFYYRPFIWATRHDVRSGDYYEPLDVILSIFVLIGPMLFCFLISIFLTKITR